MLAIGPTRPIHGAALQLRRRSSERRRREVFRGVAGSDDGEASATVETAVKCPVIGPVIGGVVAGVARYQAAARLTGPDAADRGIWFAARRRVYLIV